MYFEFIGTEMTSLYFKSQLIAVIIMASANLVYTLALTALAIHYLANHLEMLKNEVWKSMVCAIIIDINICYL